MSLKHVLCSALLPLLLLFGCGDDGPQRGNSRGSLPAVEVAIETLAVRPVPSRVELAATLQAAKQTTIAARLSGQVAVMPVEVGSRVKRGDLLVELDAAEVAARANSAETLLDRARRDLEREAQLLELEASTRETVRRLREQVKLAEAAAVEARTLLSYTRLRAPFAGTVTARLVEVGDLASPGRPLLQLEAAALEAVVAVPEQAAGDLAVGRRLPLNVPAAGLQLDAEISEIAPTVEPASRSVRIKLALPHKPSLHSGQFARVRLPGGTVQRLTVAASSLKRNGQMEQVFVAELGRARLRLVRSGVRLTGDDNAERIEILTGLRAGDRVVLDPPLTLRDGQPLTLVDEDAR
jgi:RND family efflux transporter MFP subunit